MAQDLVAGGDWFCIFHRMSFAEIERQAMALSDRERASLAATLLNKLPPPGADASDAEVERREQELDSGVAGISHAKFVRCVELERRK